MDQNGSTPPPRQDSRPAIAAWNAAATPSKALDRCIAMGIAACGVSISGAIVSSTDQVSGLRAWLRSPTVRDRIRAAAIDGARATDDVRPLFPGASAVVVRHTDGSVDVGATVCVFLTPEALRSQEFDRACTEAGLDVESTRAHFAPLTTISGAGAVACARAVRLMSADLATIDEQARAIDGFTRNLTDAYDTMDLLYTLGRSMKAPFDPRRFIASMCERLHSTMNFSWVAVRFSTEFWIADGLRDTLYFAGELPMARDRLIRAAAPVLQQASSQPVVMSTLPGFDGHQMLAQVVFCKGAPVGLVMAGGKHGTDPDVSSYDIQLIEAAAGFLNAFADNVALYEDQHSLFLGTVQALTAAIDAKDRYTCGHSERVAHLAAQLAVKLGMSREQAERVRIAGLVHDVGKIGVPESVLTKPGKLTDAEFANIKMHPEIGHRILKDIPQLDDVLPGVLYHHERIDGRGYPEKLGGEDIPLLARILAVADTFDAMSSDRSYRKGKPREEVIAEIERCAGSQLDPAIAMLVRSLSFADYDRMVARHAAGQINLAA